ncbi:hypothetical protein ABMA28_000012 [Loxostege sticticalis]|uniref:Exosome complex component 10 homolog n=1 Tax=Loxostege sticticalis TaxID=481309 RepID=A0ABD0TQP7_LOXSC
MNSVLNPEAPEFYPHLTSVTQGGYTTVHRTIRSSNHLPLGASYDLFKTFTDFNVVTRQLSENVVAQTNQILVTELPAVKLRLNDNEYNTEKVVDANDSMVDRVNIHIDTLSGVNAPSDAFLESVRRSGAWNATPVIAKIQVGSTMFIGAKNVPRPQLLFKDPVDNSDSLWVPKISDKPNNIKPLALSILYNDEGEAVGYEHPYQVELELYHPPGELIDPDPAAPAFPPPLEETRLTLVETAEQLDQLVAHLATVKELAVDLEHHSYRSYQGITCLMQISTSEGGDFIVDTLAARDHIHKLNVIFTDPKKLKVFHGAESDILWLQRDFGVYVVGLFDTHRAARQLNLPALSLKGLLAHYCNVTADKKFQLADWRIRPLPAELVQYARTDTHYLLYVWRRMKAELLARAAGQPRLLLAVFEASRQLCGATYNKETIREDSHLQLYVRSRKQFNSQQMAALKLLYKWRDAHARELDESTTYLLPNHMLMALAETLPREVQGVNACCSPTPPFVKQHLLTIHRMLLSCRELPQEPLLFPAAPTTRGAAPAQPARPHDLHDLAHFADRSEDQPINLERAEQLLAEGFPFHPDIPAFEPAAPPAAGVVSALNVDAKLFIPPFDRYRKYRTLAQIEEKKEFKEKEARIAAISKGNELIKTEVLIKLRAAATQLDAAPRPAADADDAAPATDADAGKKAQRKRKISEKERKEPPPSRAEPPAAARAAAKPKNVKLAAEPSATLKPFAYKNVNYTKFYDAEKTRKQPKMKFKKHK